MRTKDRLKRLLEQDKEEINEASREAALADFKRVAEEYFETDGGFLFTTRQGEKGTEVVFAFRMIRAKNFTRFKQF
ncbi:MAG: hypothetical protein IKD43_01420 [Clostridia bacterium]|nr:hypothetical protein [Clostridia bacterium]